MFEHTYPRRRPDVETHLLPDGSCLLFDPEQAEGHTLNLAGALVWDYCDGTLTGAEIVQELDALLPQQADVHQDTTRLLAQLAERGLLLPPMEARDLAPREAHGGISEHP
jgi:hypothetical protein